MPRLRKLFLLDEHTCPWWFVYAFDNPVRRLVHNAGTMLSGLVEEGQSVVDVGCGAGYFSVALARMVGPKGKVLGLDIQPRMLEMAHRRAIRMGLDSRIEFRLCESDRLGIGGPVDFALAFWVVHEVPEQERLLGEIRAALKPSGRLLLVEPKVHVPRARFEETVESTMAAGFEMTRGPTVRLSRSALLVATASGGGR